MVIHNIYILQPNGLLLFSKDYHSIKEDAVVVSGFLSAIDSFAQSMGAGNEVKSIETDKYKFVGAMSKKHKIKFIVICDKKDDMTKAEALLKSLSRSFIKKHAKLLNLKNPYNDLNQYKEWESNLDKIINDSDLSSFNSVFSETLKGLKKIFKKV